MCFARLQIEGQDRAWGEIQPPLTFTNTSEKTFDELDGSHLPCVSSQRVLLEGGSKPKTSSNHDSQREEVSPPENFPSIMDME